MWDEMRHRLIRRKVIWDRVEDALICEEERDPVLVSWTRLGWAEGMSCLHPERCTMSPWGL